MNIKIYIPPKIKDKDELNAIQEYEKRLSRYCKFKIITIKSVEELSKLPEKIYKIKISPIGQVISSEDLAERINRYGLTGKSDVAFILEQEIDADEHLALSKMTMGTGISTTVLIEQIYRAYRIMRNEPYHK
jgi:23S rRNA (pseudouridine1915-N3)-methyltransferase